MYVNAAFDVTTVPAADVCLLPVLARCITDLGTDAESYVEVSQRIGRFTGGVSASLWSGLSSPGSPGTAPGDAAGAVGAPMAKLMVRGKAVEERSEDLMAIMGDVLVRLDFDAQDRVLSILRQMVARAEASVLESGHAVAAARLNARHPDPQAALLGWWKENTGGGVSFLYQAREMAAQCENDWRAFRARLEGLRHTVVQRGGCTMSLTAGGGALDSIASGPMSSFVGGLPGAAGDGGESEGVWDGWQEVGLLPKGGAGDAGLLLPEGFVVPTQVNYVSKRVDLSTDYAYHASAEVACNMLRTGWLWDQVRVVGGAYGAFVSASRKTGSVQMGSYRDPNVDETLAAFDGCAAALPLVIALGGSEEVPLERNVTHRVREYRLRGEGEGG
jgi:Zn-dependent M16 (insulinase) family peptidase